jgi:hypothetical protein
MATEDILIRYRADVSQLESDINKVIDSQEELTKATKDNTQAQQKAVNSAEFAARKRAQLLEQEQQKLVKLREVQKLAFDPVRIEKFNRQIQESEKRISLLQGEVKDLGPSIQQSLNGVTNSIKNIAGAFGVAFSLDAVVNFSKQAVNAFLAAEKSVDDLRDAIVVVGNEGESAFQGLNQEAEALGQTTIFSADEVRNAQAILSSFGLLPAEISKLIPKLAGFADATKVNIVDAAQQIGSALDGTGKQFKNLGVNIETTNTPIQNYNQLIIGLDKYTQNATLSVGNLNDEVAKQEKLVSSLEQFVGSKLADSWTKVKIGIIGAAAALLGYNQENEKIKQKAKETAAGNVNALVEELKLRGASEEQILEKLEKRLQAQQKNAADEQAIIDRQLKNKEALNQNLRDQIEADKERAAKVLPLYQEEAIATQKVIDDIKTTIATKKQELTIDQIKLQSTKQLSEYVEKNKNNTELVFQSNIQLINKELEAREKANEIAVANAQKALEQFKNLINSIDAEIAKLESDLERRKIEVIPADSQKAQEDRIKALADLNEKAINDEIAGKVKLVQEDANLSQKQKADVIAKYEELKAARLALATFNEQNELNIISKEQADRIEAAYAKIDALDLEQALTIQADKVETANDAVAKSFEDLSKAISKDDFAAAKKAAEDKTKILNDEIKNEQNLNLTRIDNARQTELAKVKEGESAAAERAAINKDFDNQIVNSNKEVNDQIAENNKELNDNINTNTQRSVDERKAILFEQLQYTQQLFAELANIYNSFSEKRISDIEKERDAQLESIDAQLEQNAEYLDKRRISEEEAAANEKALQAEKLRIEEQTQKKINQEKRKQAILNKAAAIFEIGLNTAIALSNPSNLASFGAFSPFIAALGALQVAAVLAQPIPYRKGSKNTGSNEHLARVGEEGEELVFMPSNSKVLPARQTKKYSEIIDAMYDNKLDDYVYKNYITPALMAQKEAKDNQRAKSFADNMASSIFYNQAGLTPSDLEAQRKRGQYIRNVDEIAEAIAKKLPIRDIYRA